MSMTIFDSSASTLETAWYLDTPAGPIPQAGGNVSLDRSWTPVLQATTEYNTDHELADQIEPLSPDPLVLRLRTQTAGLPILDAGNEKPQNLLSNGDFENGLDGWTVSNGSAIVTTSYNDRMWGGLGGRLMQLTATDTAQWATIQANVPISAAAGKWVAFAALLACESASRVRLQARHYLNGYFYNSSSQYTAAFYTGRRVEHAAFIPEGATMVQVQLQLNKPIGEAGRRMWADKVIAVAADTEAEARAGVAEFRPGSLGEYEWPAPDIVGARVNQATYWVYPRSTREDVVNRRTSVELASADLLMTEVRNGSGEPWIAAPSTDDSYGRTDYVMTRSLSQAILHAGLPITVLADDAETSPLDEPTWAVADNLTSFMQALLHSRYEWQFNPRLNQYQLRYQPPQPGSYSLGSAGRRLQSAVITRGDSTELGTLDYADGLIIYWRWTSAMDGSSHEFVETVLADNITDWRQVTKWAELTINSSPQNYGQHLLGNRADRRAQALITAALDGWSIDDLGLKWSDAASSYQTLSFSVDGGTYTINGPLREG